MDSYAYGFHCTRRACICVLSLLIILDCYFHVYVYYNVLRGNDNRKVYDIYAGRELQNETILYYKYPLVNSEEILMDFKNRYTSSYYWFMSMQRQFKNIGEEVKYSNNTPTCQLNITSGPIFVNKTEQKLEWIEKLNPDVKVGGYYAPAQCQALHRVAVIIAHRDREANLSVLLRYLHPLMKKQQLEYRIFVIEQYGSTEKFNKGILYNIAFLETQRFGMWHCLIFHDVNLIPEDERISYACPKLPTHMSPAIESFGYDPPYPNNFSGVTSFPRKDYETVNGYSNLYWDEGAEIDENMYQRLKANYVTVSRYNSSIARFAKLSDPRNERRLQRILFLGWYRSNRGKEEGLRTTKYNIIRITNENLYTNILADVNPTKVKIETSLMQKYLFN